MLVPLLAFCHSMAFVSFATQGEWDGAVWVVAASIWAYRAFQASGGGE